MLTARNNKNFDKLTLSFLKLKLNLVNHLAIFDEKRIELNGKLFDMLEYLVIADLINKVALPYIETAKLDNKEFTVEGESLMVKADFQKIKQVLIILFDNALKYTNPMDKISAEVNRVKNKCEIIISDTGIGINEQELNRVFERFYRGDNTRGTTEGSGLGSFHS